MAGVLLSPERASQAVDPRISPAHLALHVGRRPDGTSSWQLYQWVGLLNRELMKLARYRITGRTGPDSIRFLAVEAPIRHGKSETGTIHFPAWWMGTFPDDPLIVGGYKTTFVERFSRRIRQIVRFYGPDVFDIALSKESSAVDQWGLEPPHMGQLVVSSPQAAPTGIGAKLMVIDDPIRSVKEAYSETYRNWVWDWWQFDMRSRLEPGGVVLWIMSRWHEDDPLGRLRARQAEAVKMGKKFSDEMSEEELANTPPEEVIDRFHFLRLPALADPGLQPQDITDEEWAETLQQWRDELGRRPGEALCPQRFNKAALLEMRDSPTGIGPIAFAALMQANPTPAKGLIFDVDGAGGGVGFRFEDEVPLWKMRWVRRWDLAATEKKTADWTAGVLMGRSEETGMTYIADVRRVQLGPADVENYMAATANWDEALLGQKVRQHWPQDPGAAGKAAANYLSRSDGLADQDTDYTPETGDKVARAMPLAGQVKAGNVVLIRGAWNHDFIEECVIGSTMIHTTEGLVPASDVRVGDQLLTHLGRFRPVLATRRRWADQTVHLRAKTLESLILTAEHPVRRLRLEGARKPGRLDWIPAGQLEVRHRFERQGGARPEVSQRPHDALTFPRLAAEIRYETLDLADYADQLGASRRSKIASTSEAVYGVGGGSGWTRRQIPLDHETGRLFGLYLAEGSTTNGAAWWSFHRKEPYLDEVEKFLEGRLGVRARRHASGLNCVSVGTGNGLLAAITTEMGTKAQEKRLAPWMWHAPPDFQRGLIEGWADGDGHLVRTGRTGRSVSSHLAWGMRLLLTAQGLPAVINWQEGRDVEIAGRPTQSRRIATVAWGPDRRSVAVPLREAFGYSLMVKEAAPGQFVHNFHVQEDESYVTTGGTVHNCRAFNLGAHDDQVDAAANGYNDLAGLNRGKVRLIL